ncbi:DUF1810 domain-containing protein [Aquibium oceanicum]|uniref:Calpastatin n=1 Tax=Aquibium oceanicum TaxID=1670800 RepID=A0A1L3SQX1_9HYPH|nr:DUF1810 domain-containing protein [Aquibium oceanicum]APH71692.1 calpastatin [Aquibium oceanicum]
MSDPHDLRRFVQAQEPVYADVLAELRDGRKRSHWMWFVFPQVAGLGSSGMARRYAIGSLDEAKAYLADPVLGDRLVECTTLVLAWPDRPLHDIFGSPDDMKFCSSMTLFAQAAGPGSVFGTALDTFCDGPDRRTLQILGEQD